jgi:hypothetical protein
MGVHILLALPVIVVPFRRSIEALETALVAMFKMRGSAAPVVCDKSASLQRLSESLLGNVLDHAEQQ